MTSSFQNNVQPGVIQVYIITGCLCTGI